MNVLILAAGPQEFDAHDGTYPACLTEVNGVPVIERVVNACRVAPSTSFSFALSKRDAQRHHLNNIVDLLAPGCNVILVESETQGAACTALLAAKWIDQEQELVIASSNELLNIDLNYALTDYRLRGLDAGVITFPSVHPRYSYARLDDQNLAVEVAEKKPISRHAMTSIIWFARGSDFVRAAQNMIRKDSHIDGLFYIAPSLNELILRNMKVGAFSIDAMDYMPLKTERQLDRFESALNMEKSH